MTLEFRIGCTGWGYKEWQGTFYPKTTRQKDWLRHYSSIFNITEVNSSFYHVVPKQMAQKWYNETPDDFVFTLKFPREITHDNRLEYEKSKSVMNSFFSGLEPLKKKIKVLVLQLPPSLDFETTKPRLEVLMRHLPNYCRYAIEGRNETWFYSESIDFMTQNKFCLAWSEVPMVENPAPITTDFVYARLIGDRNLQDDAYDRRMRDQTRTLQKWANRLLCLQKNQRIKFAYAMMNNHLEGFAPSSANSLRSLMGYEELEFHDRNQKTIF